LVFGGKHFPFVHGHGVPYYYTNDEKTDGNYWKWFQWCKIFNCCLNELGAFQGLRCMSLDDIFYEILTIFYILYNTLLEL